MDCKTAQQKIMPYIERKLNDHDAEDFIEHIRGCKACSEELEVYFTIYYALEQLDNNTHETFDIQELLERELQQAENTVRKHNIVSFYRRLLMALIGIISAVFLITVTQFFFYGSFEKTTLFVLFGNEESETVQRSTQASESRLAETAEEAEQETNHKRQVIVTIPETEAREAK